MRKKIGILTTFYEWNKAYSLTSVVESQLITLVKYGYETVLFVHDNFKDEDKIPEGVEIRKVIPRFALVDYGQNQPIEEGFWKQVEESKKALEEHLQDIDIAFTHDWLFQGWFLCYNVAMRQAQSKLKCRWFHWTHSAPSPRPQGLKYPLDRRYNLMPNSKIIYMNDYDALKMVEMYGGFPNDIRIVYNPLDPRSFWKLDLLVSKMIDKFKLLEADVIDVYPISSTRFAGKQPEKVLRILGEIKKQGKSVRFICPNAHANADNEKKAIEEIIKYGVSRGLTREEIIFTSLEGKEYELGVSNEVVRDLFQLSNLFIFPTLSENCPLILLEAALSKCLLVLNESVPSLRDFFGKNALYFPFSSLVTDVKYQNEEQWYAEVAKIIIAELSTNKPLNAFNHAKQRFNYDYIFKQQLEPLFYEKWD